MCAKYLSQSLPLSKGQMQTVILELHDHREVGAAVGDLREEGEPVDNCFLVLNIKLISC